MLPWRSIAGIKTTFEYLCDETKPCIRHKFASAQGARVRGLFAAYLGRRHDARVRLKRSLHFPMQLRTFPPVCKRSPLNTRQRCRCRQAIRLNDCTNPLPNRCPTERLNSVLCHENSALLRHFVRFARFVLPLTFRRNVTLNLFSCRTNGLS